MSGLGFVIVIAVLALLLGWQEHRNATVHKPMSKEIDSGITKLQRASSSSRSIRR